MKRPLAVLAYAVLLACGSSPTSNSPQGTAFFTIDNASCAYSGSKDVTFYIAALEVGTQSLATGATSTGYLTKATEAYPRSGHPVVQARLANYTPSGGALWTARNYVNVPTDGSVTYTFTC